MPQPASARPRSDSEPSRFLGDRRRLFVVSAIAISLWVASTVWFGILQAREVPADYLSYWAAGELIEGGAAEFVYDPDVHHRQTEEFTGPRDSGFIPFLLPPHFLFAARGLAAAGYFIGFVAVVGLSVVTFGLALRRIVPDRLALALGFASPPTVANTQIGQVGLIMAAAGAVALLDHRRHPWRSGLALGVLSVKPQFGIGIGLALAVVGAWPALSVGLLISLGLMAGSSLVFGPDRWLEFWETVSDSSGMMEFIRNEASTRDQSFRALISSFGLEGSTPWLLHFGVAAVLAVLVLRLVYRLGLTPRTMAMVLVMSVLISPRAFGYDFALVVPAALWLAVDSPRPPVATRAVLAGCAFLLLLALLGYPTGVLVGMAMLWLAAADTAETMSVPVQGLGLRGG